MKTGYTIYRRFGDPSMGQWTFLIDPGAVRVQYSQESAGTVHPVFDTMCEALDYAADQTEFYLCGCPDFAAKIRSRIVMWCKDKEHSHV